MCSFCPILCVKLPKLENTDCGVRFFGSLTMSLVRDCGGEHCLESGVLNSIKLDCIDFGQIGVSFLLMITGSQ